MNVVTPIDTTAHEPASRALFVERIKAAWHKSREKIIALGNALIEAKRALPHGEFEQMLAQDLPFGAQHARRFMRIASDPRLTNRAHVLVLPESLRALDKLEKLDDLQFECAIATGRIHKDMTEREADTLLSEMQIRSGYSQPVGPKQHRPLASRMGPPTAPAGIGARSYPELVYLLAERRRVVGMTQRELDEHIGWTEGQTSKYEIPHADDGRTADTLTIFDWMQGLGCTITLSPLSQP